MSFSPSPADCGRAGHAFGAQRHIHSIPSWQQLSWVSASWFLLSVHSLLCCSSPAHMQLAMSLGKSKNEDQDEEVLLFVCLFVSITSKYGSCNTLFHQLMRMQDRALMLEELRRPSCLSSTFCKITSIHLERRIKKASCYMALSPINLPATNTRMQLSRKRWHLIFWQLWKATSEKKQSWESSRHHSAAVKVKWLMATTFVFLFWQNLIY